MLLPVNHLDPGFPYFWDVSWYRTSRGRRGSPIACGYEWEWEGTHVGTNAGHRHDPRYDDVCHDARLDRIGARDARHRRVRSTRSRRVAVRVQTERAGVPAHSSRTCSFGLARASIRGSATAFAVFSLAFRVSRCLGCLGVRGDIDTVGGYAGDDRLVLDV
jgi:hypothetical protein